MPLFLINTFKKHIKSFDNLSVTLFLLFVTKLIVSTVIYRTPSKTFFANTGKCFIKAKSSVILFLLIRAKA